MGTEVAVSFSSLRAQLENEKSSLFKIDENIKKIVQTTGRFNDRFNGPGEYARGANRPGGRNFLDSGGFNKNEDLSGKRKHETKTVFSRLSAKLNDSDGEDDSPGIKRARVPSAVSRELPTRAAVLRAQGDDEQARKRNRRIFGSLLGTLQKFKQEEIVLQTKEEKKAQVERKIEEQARLEKEREQKERKTLFAEREHKKATIKALEAKMARVQEFEKWETTQRTLGNFILTKAKPHMYWLPKKMTDKATEKLDLSRKYNEKCISNAKAGLQDELKRIEARCLRTRPYIHNENVPQQAPVEEENKEGRKRDKFAMDSDMKEDSDGDDRHDDDPTPTVPQEPKVEEQTEPERDESKMDTTVENNTSTDMDTDVQANDTANDSVLTADDSMPVDTVQPMDDSAVSNIPESEEQPSTESAPA